MYTDTFNLIVQVNHLLSNKQIKTVETKKKGWEQKLPPPSLPPNLDRVNSFFQNIYFLYCLIKLHNSVAQFFAFIFLYHIFIFTEFVVDFSPKKHAQKYGI